MQRLPRGVITAIPFVVVILVVVTLATILIRSGPDPSPPVVVGPAPLVSPVCPTDPAIYGESRPDPSTRTSAPDPPAGAIPTGFVPVRFRLCVLEDIVSASGKVTWIVHERTEGVTPELITTLSQPDDDEDQSCPTYSVTSLVFFLVDASGNTIRPHLPEADCGATKPEVENLIWALQYQQTTTPIQAPRAP